MDNIKESFPWEPSYGFGETDRVKLASALEMIRRQSCHYGEFSTNCDCKYGLGRKLTAPDEYLTSEASGCPELRSAIRMLLHPEDVEDVFSILEEA